MTREEFMKARLEIDLAFFGLRNQMINLVEQAWAESKRNAELGNELATVKEALERQKKPETEDNDDANCRDCIAAGR